MTCRSPDSNKVLYVLQSNGMKDKLGLTRIRSAIVALRTSGNVQDACQAANVELYLIATKRQA